MKIVLAIGLATLVGCATEDETSKLTAAVGECGPLETHVVGVFDSPTNDVILRVDRPGKHAIVVSAHEGTNWKVEAAPGAKIEAIYAVGYGKQTVKAPAGVRVVTESRDQGGPFACGYAWNASTPECDTDNLMNLVRYRVHEPTSFHGCKSATEFRIGEDLAVSSDCGLDAASYTADEEAEGSEQSSAVMGCDGPDSCGGPIIL
ncbi:MAG: hypothetical protein AB7O24_26200 [Kofleriaceae bacterium]